MNILLSAYACEPGKGSEPGVGWAWIKQLAPKHNLWVVTRANNKEAIETRETQFPANVRFIYVDLPPFLRFWKRGAHGVNLYYFLWQILAWKRCLKLVSTETIDLAHHVTLMSVTRFSFVTLLGIPSVIGPVGGLQKCPKGARSFIRRPFREGLRDFLISTLWINPAFRLSVGRADRLVLATNFGKDNLPARKNASRLAVFQIGADLPPVDIKALVPKWLVGEYIILWSGRLEDHKGFEILIRAVAHIKATSRTTFLQLQVVVTGNGPEKAFYLELLHSLKIEDRFYFAGWLERETYEQLWYRADVFVFTSLRETTGVALQEAMLRGKACVVVANGGPGDMITTDTGVPISPNNPKDLVRDFSHALVRLHESPELRRALGEMAAVSAKAIFSWTTVARKMEAIYRKAFESSKKE